MQWITLVTIALGSGVISSLITSIINGYFTSRSLTRTIVHQTKQTALTLHAQVEQAHWNDARALRDTRRERLRASYAALIAGVQELYNLATLTERRDMRFLPVNSMEDRQRRIENTRQQAASILQDANKQHQLLVLEGGTQEFVTTYLVALDAFQKHRNMHHYNENGQGSFSEEQIKAEFARLLAAREKLDEMARNHLAALDQPIPALPISCQEPKLRRPEADKF